jgi:hypothetical protein
LEGIIIHSALAGGTGSGVMTQLISRLGVSLGKNVTIGSNLIYASNIRHCPNVTEAYNAVLSTQDLLEHSKFIMVSTNHGLHNYCQQHLGVESPSLKEINSLNSQAVSHLAIKN